MKTTGGPCGSGPQDVLREKRLTRSPSCSRITWARNFRSGTIKIFATDLAADAITFARRGLYPENVLKDLPDEYRDRFFERVDHGYQVSKSLRQAVIFGQQDISRGVPFPRIDLVTCRNLLIYLKPDLQQVVLDLFAYSLHNPMVICFWVRPKRRVRPKRLLSSSTRSGRSIVA